MNAECHVLLYVFDADGTLRRTTVPGQPCPHGPREWELLPGVTATLRRIPFGRDGPYLGVASNQDHVGYGLLSMAQAHALLTDLIRAAVGEIVPAPGVRLCPHPQHVGCGCRKPAPGMLNALMRHFRVTPAHTLFVGDADCDREAALRAGVSFCWAEAFFGREGRGFR